MSAPDCQRAGRWFGCKFEARYDRVEPKDHFWQTFRYATGPDAVKAQSESTIGKTTYVRDVCVRCGQTIERVTP